MNVEQLKYKNSRAAYDAIFKPSTVLTDIILHGNCNTALINIMTCEQLVGRCNYLIFIQHISFSA